MADRRVIGTQATPAHPPVVAHANRRHTRPAWLAVVLIAGGVLAAAAYGHLILASMMVVTVGGHALSGSV
jgi:hypothetical protein